MTHTKYITLDADYDDDLCLNADMEFTHLNKPYLTKVYI